MALIYLIALRLSGWQAGLAAAALYCLSPIVVETAHLVKPHSYAISWMLASVLAMLSAARTGAPRWFLACGVAAGLSAGSSVLLAPFCALPLAAALLRKKDWRAALKGCLAAACAFFALNPYLLFSPGAFAWELQIYAAPGASKPSLGALARLAAAPGARSVPASACFHWRGSSPACGEAASRGSGADRRARFFNDMAAISEL